MAKYVIDETTLTGLANEVRKVDGKNKTYTPAEMISSVGKVADDITREAELIAELQNVVDNIPSVDNGSYDEGFDDGFADGKQAEYDRFWDVYQDNGNRTLYDRDFCGTGWTTQTFKPKYDIKPIGQLQSIFRGSNIQGDLPAICAEQGITIDFSGATSGTEWFFQSKFTRIGTVDTRGVSNLNRFFSICLSLVTIDNIILKEDGTQKTADFLYDCPSLKNVTITGTIGYSIDVHDSTRLTRTSILSIINALSDTTTGQTLTLSETAVNTAFGDEGNYGMDTSEWIELRDSKPNWTITLV